MMYPKAIETIPAHLEPYIVRQDAIEYTPIDHASWRYIIRVSKRFFAKTAHPSYLDGLEKTGISTDRIPSISEMDKKLRMFGWRAVAVSGFIPPSVFMEFQSLGILPIACDMRKLENLSYTPAPDIVHEAAGHAPIIADPAYSSYLRHYGEISRKALANQEDFDVYLAIRNLSEVKEDPRSTEEDISSAQQQLDLAASKLGAPSEAAMLARMNWWSIEYGLVGEMGSPKIYGAGLLSSVGESFHCLSPEVKKIPFTVDCIKTSYDITKPQPQLFVTKNFEELTRAIDDFANTMAYRKGGVFGLERAIESRLVNTVMFDSGIQMSGKLIGYETDASGKPVYLCFKGPTQLAYEDVELSNQGPNYHKEGFGTAVGTVRGKSPAELTDKELSAFGFSETVAGTLIFDQGVKVTGKLIGKTHKDGKNLILSFKDCTVEYQGRILFEPAWGTYDMACGSSIPSVFGGAADRASYMKATEHEQRPKPQPKSNLTSENRRLNALYAVVRKQRDGTTAEFSHNILVALEEVYRELARDYPKDWLLRLEILEVLRIHNQSPSWKAGIKKDLEDLKQQSTTMDELISRGLQVS